MVMKKLISISFMSIVAIAAFAQSPLKPENVPTDSMGKLNSDMMVSSPLDSSQFSNEAYTTNTADYDWNQKGKRKSYKRTAKSSSSTTTRKTNASGKNYK